MPRVAVLELDGPLARLVPAERRQEAHAALLAEAMDVPAGGWSPPLDRPEDELGMLVAEGLFLRDVSIAGRTVSEVLGRGDVLWPAGWDAAGAPLAFRVTWTALEPGQVLVLDRDFVRAAARHPEVLTALHHRAVSRTHVLSARLVIDQLSRIDARLLVVLWHLADRWGRVTTQGVELPLRLTHEVLAQIVGARRPSVTLAMGELVERGALTRLPDRCYVLHGEPSEQLERLLARQPTPGVEAPRVSPRASAP